jgi:hypothetical protein
MLKIDPMCHSEQNSEQSCRNFSIESAKVGFPCAINPKGPIGNACTDFAESTTYDLAIDCLSKFPGSIHVGYVQSNNPSIPWLDRSNGPHVVYLTDELGVSDFFDFSELSKLPRNASEYSTVTEIRRAIIPHE